MCLVACTKPHTHRDVTGGLCAGSCSVSLPLRPAPGFHSQPCSLHEAKEQNCLLVRALTGTTFPGRG